MALNSWAIIITFLIIVRKFLSLIIKSFIKYLVSAWTDLDNRIDWFVGNVDLFYGADKSEVFTDGSFGVRDQLALVLSLLVDFLWVAWAYWGLGGAVFLYAIGNIQTWTAPNFFVDPHRFQDKSEVAVTVTIVPRDSTDVWIVPSISGVQRKQGLRNGPYNLLGMYRAS